MNSICLLFIVRKEKEESSIPPSNIILSSTTAIIKKSHFKFIEKVMYLVPFHELLLLLQTKIY
jgi:hypothetical protein